MSPLNQVCVLYTLLTKKKNNYTRYTVQKDSFSSHWILHKVRVTKIIAKVTTFSRTHNTFCTMFRAQGKKTQNKTDKSLKKKTTRTNGLLKAINVGSVLQLKSQLGLCELLLLLLLLSLQESSSRPVSCPCFHSIPFSLLLQINKKKKKSQKSGRVGRQARGGLFILP